MLLSSLSAFVFATVIGLLPIINPLSTTALLLAITHDLTPAERKRQVTLACAYQVGILTTFLLAGELIMTTFGISIPGLQIAGGLVVSFIGFRMLFPDEQPLPRKVHEEARAKPDVAFTPLAMPMLAGPGSIAVVIGMSSSIRDLSRGAMWMGFVSVIIGILITSVVCWLTLRSAGWVQRTLGTGGVSAVGRIMGFLLICLGVQFIINGISSVVHGFSTTLI
ncbi:MULTISPECIES: MarC family NAAT transporter [Microvirgula]|uniref:UPF0056 membrane protein n=1 Tax=Microvirgula aerodenitrificans TaxID=57480 RepID=A0A2S0P9K7_9NEIS|nr:MULTISPECIES: MarC family NAAT transporter [Microvirgula]AVY94094.1 stress protection protein MarC [Microvirgula aerodenitrificans]RAS13797.1 multiple antibiotic resistance protein [Microvirgula sp. AG722]